MRGISAEQCFFWAINGGLMETQEKTVVTEEHCKKYTEHLVLRELDINTVHFLFFSSLLMGKERRYV